jgi:hypothetical protein
MAKAGSTMPATACSETDRLAPSADRLRKSACRASRKRTSQTAYDMPTSLASSAAAGPRCSTRAARLGHSALVRCMLSRRDKRLTGTKCESESEGIAEGSRAGHGKRAMACHRCRGGRGTDLSPEERARSCAT